MNFPSNYPTALAENTFEGPQTNRQHAPRLVNSPNLLKGTAMTVAVIPQDGTEPIASFPDMETALAWGLQQYKGQPFVVRVFAQDAEAGAAIKGAEITTQRRRPAAKAAAVATVLQAARKAAQKEFIAKEMSRQRVVAH